MSGIDWLRRWMGSDAPPRGWADDCPAGLPVPEVSDCDRCDSVPLVALAPGERGCITCLQQPGSVGASKLSALGLLPGIELEVVQRFPAFVLRLGYAEIALDDALATAIRVRRG